MDRVASLVLSATSLRRKLLASLPWGYRLASIFLAMDSSSVENWARQMGALMLQAGVTGLPDPGPRWDAAKASPSTLPRNYLFDFGKKSYGVALKKVGNPEDASDAMMDVMMSYVSGKSSFKAGASSSAMSFVLKGVEWAANTIRKKTQKAKGRLAPSGDDDEGDTMLEVVDNAFESNPYWNENPRQFSKIEDVFPKEVWRGQVLPEVAKVHPDMPFFFTLLEDGYTAKEVIEQGMLPDFEPEGFKSPVQTWNAKVQKAKEVIRQLARQLA